MGTPDNSNKLGTGRKVWLAVLILVAISILFTQKMPWSIFGACGLLLSVWAAYYFPGPSANQTLAEIHESYKQGKWRSPKHVRTIMLLAVILMFIGSVGACNHPA